MPSVWQLVWCGVLLTEIWFGRSGGWLSVPHSGEAYRTRWTGIYGIRGSPLSGVSRNLLVSNWSRRSLRASMTRTGTSSRPPHQRALPADGIDESTPSTAGSKKQQKISRSLTLVVRCTLWSQILARGTSNRRDLISHSQQLMWRWRRVRERESEKRNRCF